MDDTLADKAYAVTVGGDVRTSYNVVIAQGTAPTLKDLGFAKEDGTALEFKHKGTNRFDRNFIAKNHTNPKYFGDASNPNAKLQPGVWYYLDADAAAAFYDAHLVFSDDDKTLFGIETMEEDGVIAIRVTKTPDQITKAAFELTIQNIANDGSYQEAKIWLGETSAIDSSVEYALITHELKADDDKNFFSISLDPMKNALGATGRALWNSKVDHATLSYLDKDGKPYTTGTGIVLNHMSVLKDKLSTSTTAASLKDATDIAFAITNATAGDKFTLNEIYTAVVKFFDANNEELNTIEVPFKLTLPSITDLFVIDPGFIAADGVVNCYLDVDDSKVVAGSLNNTVFKLGRVFSKFDYTSGGFKITLDNNTVITDDKKSAALAELFSGVASSGLHDNVVISDACLAYITLSGTTGSTGTEKGYNQALIYTISGKFANAWTYPADETFSFKARVMSPIEQGTVAVKGATAITIKASALDGYVISNDDVVGYTYNKAVSYKVMPDKVATPAAAAWTRPDILNVTGVSGNPLYFTVVGLDDATNITDTNDNVVGVKEGGLKLSKGSMVDHTVETTIKVTVQDIWMQKKEVELPVRITVE